MIPKSISYDPWDAINLEIDLSTVDRNKAHVWNLRTAKYALALSKAEGTNYLFPSQKKILECFFWGNPKSHRYGTTPQDYAWYRDIE